MNTITKKHFNLMVNNIGLDKETYLVTENILNNQLIIKRHIVEELYNNCSYNDLEDDAFEALLQNTQLVFIKNEGKKDYYKVVTTISTTNEFHDVIADFLFDSNRIDGIENMGFYGDKEFYVELVEEQVQMEEVIFQYDDEVDEAHYFVEDEANDFKVCGIKQGLIFGVSSMEELKAQIKDIFEENGWDMGRVEKELPFFNDFRELVEHYSTTTRNSFKIELKFNDNKFTMKSVVYNNSFMTEDKVFTISEDDFMNLLDSMWNEYQLEKLNVVENNLLEANRLLFSMASTYSATSKITDAIEFVNEFKKEFVKGDKNE